MSKGNKGNTTPRMITVPCPTCRGDGRIGNRTCSLCKGKGEIRVPDE